MPVAAALILARWAAERWLDHLNRRNVLAHAGTVPDVFRETIDAATYAKSAEYTLAKARFGAIEATFDAVVLAVVLFSGVLPWWFGWFAERFGESAWAIAAFLFGTGMLLSLSGLPFAWHAQFQLEEHFGFNTTTPKIWWLDRLKGLVLAVVLGYPLLALILKLVEWIGPHWWLWAWGCVLGFELVMLVLAPVLIMPLFNKFTPLPEGGLRERLLALAGRTGFRARSIQMMDGSKRSRHSNAFFTGFGRFRKIVLFDTLMQQLSEPEIEAVLAHEIGHYKKRHIPKTLVWSAASLLFMFCAVAWLSRQEWFYRGFGFQPGGIAPALLLFTLLGGTITFWFSPVAHWWSRKHEYEADAFAAQAMKRNRIR